MKALHPAFAGPAAAAALAILSCGAAFGQPTPLPLPPPPPPVADSRTADQTSADIISGDYTLSQREDRLAALIEHSRADHSLGLAEYRRVSAELADIRGEEERSRRRHHGELTDAGAFRLEGRIKTLAASIRWRP